MADRSGEQFGDYRLIRLLGEGTFGEVYLGEHVFLGATAAVKVLHARLDQQEFQTFLDEARKIAALNHPHIVRVLNFSMQNQMPYLVMQLAQQGTLKERFPRGQPQPLETILPYVKQAAEGLQHAHENNIIHLDIKPANMLLDARGEVLLADFGIARVLQTQRTHQTVQGFAGTFAYAAPEQFQSKPGLASDQYALAVIVYEWLTGGLPFQGDWIAIGPQKLTQDPPPLRGKVRAIPAAAEQVVLRALARDSHERFPSVQEFAEALNLAYQQKPGKDATRSSPVKSPVSSPPDRSLLVPTPLPQDSTLLRPEVSPVLPALARTLLATEQSHDPGKPEITPGDNARKWLLLRIMLHMGHFFAFPITLGLWLHSWQALGVSFAGLVLILAWAVWGLTGSNEFGELGIVAGTFVFGLAWGIVGWACGTLLHFGAFSIALGPISIQATAFSALGGVLGIVIGIIGYLALIALLDDFG